jgi:hypothetical protein
MIGSLRLGRRMSRAPASCFWQDWTKPDNRASMRRFAGSGFELDVAEPPRMLYGKQIG